MTDPDQDAMQLLAIGVAGWAVALELLSKLEGAGHP